VEPVFNSPTQKDFTSIASVAKASNLPGDRWRVSAHDEEFYDHCRMYVTDGGSTVAVEPNGNILSVCRNSSDPNATGSDLVKKAVSEGGDRLDAFGPRLYTFYTKNGFEPVSYVEFNESQAPSDWVEGRDQKEPIVFYKYTGQRTKMSYEDFLGSKPPSFNYETAKSDRDKEMTK